MCSYSRGNAKFAALITIFTCHDDEALPDQPELALCRMSIPLLVFPCQCFIFKISSIVIRILLNFIYIGKAHDNATPKVAREVPCE